MACACWHKAGTLLPRAHQGTSTALALALGLAGPMSAIFFEGRIIRSICELWGPPGFCLFPLSHCCSLPETWLILS